MKQLLFKYMTKFTNLSEEEQQKITSEIPVESFPKGTILLHQGEVPTKCYFVLEGCVRQYAVHENGKEVTSNFFTEEQAVSIFNSHRTDKASEYTLVCLEDSVLVVGHLDVERDMYDKYGQLEAMTRKMIEEMFGQVQEEYAAFIAATPEERFKSLLHRRPELIERVPQHQLASYLGMTPESLSRIKKRLSRP
ncbi:Crp/Fnr family transcriptional regulator [Paenibacillus sp. N1-5-1-14]|uniref:Crp/Fnr family transcriptional regulator n=1 Tax=Paenibacillus radicibacter TaxID=2972488 RepID=UPI002159876C|nr:Crp/Fnr family transcriptional regulator [Paenibacillus radicibacter]MCR8642906.1 Crp/Fnr family transcriptional regulator [Paenibacillus radicibacter]